MFLKKQTQKQFKLYYSKYIKSDKEKDGKCSKGIIKIFTKQKGWAKDLFLLK